VNQCHHPDLSEAMEGIIVSCLLLLTRQNLQPYG